MAIGAIDPHCFNFLADVYRTFLKTWTLRVINLYFYIRHFYVNYKNETGDS